MNGKSMLISVLLAGFFAIACVRAHEPSGSSARLSFGDFFRMPSRLERLRRSRWQWFALVALMLVLRLQQTLPVAMEIMVALEFILFLALPVSARTTPT
jgi:hypothetical protein